MTKIYLTKSPGQTRKIGERLARQILKAKHGTSPHANFGVGARALVIGLEGDLGGGKTCFLQGFAKGLGIKQKITSPTFVLMKRFQIPKQKNPGQTCVIFQNFYHIDCYRMKTSKDLLGLGFKEICSDANNIVAVEWADRVQKIIPKNALWLRFEFMNQNTRRIYFINALCYN